MTIVLSTGHAEWQRERFDFKIGEWAGGIGLIMRRTGHGSTNETGAGIWPSVEKAQAIADKTVKQLLSPECSISWMRSQAETDRKGISASTKSYSRAGVDGAFNYRVHLDPKAT